MANPNGYYIPPPQPPTSMTAQDVEDMDKFPKARMYRSKPSLPVYVSAPSLQVHEPTSATIESEETPLSRETNSVQRKPVKSSSMQIGNSAPQIAREGSGVQRKPVGSRTTMADSRIDDLNYSNKPASEHLSLPFRHAHNRMESDSEPFLAPSVILPSNANDSSSSWPRQRAYVADIAGEQQGIGQLQYHHDWEEPEHNTNNKVSHARIESTGSDLGDAQSSVSSGHLEAWGNSNAAPRPYSTALASGLHNRGRSLTPQELRSSSLSPAGNARNRSTGHSPDGRSSSQIDLLNIPYSQQMARQNLSLDNAKLRGSVGTNASLLDTKKTLEMYRANVKKTSDPDISYEFALFMISAAQAAANSEDVHNESTLESDGLSSAKEQAKLIQEARQILQRLADRTYVFAQYYLADGYASGLFNKGKPDYERAFPLFVSAGKHGHAESGFRAALCFEFGWGCRRDYAKAVQFYRQAASKGHPGASGRLGNACLTGDLGLGGRSREGIKWLKRATESADHQHNSAPYELGVLHTTGYSDDVFKDEGYAAQLFTQAAELGHAEASLRMGEAYEHGLLTCPKDPALSIHFYTGAAQGGLPKAMMALCAWYMVGAEPVLEKDEAEAYEWAKRAADHGYGVAEYAVGYFTEMGIGCRRDPLEANVWYVRAADQGDERAKQRLQIIRLAETGDAPTSKSVKKPPKTAVKKKKSVGGMEKEKEKEKEKDFKDEKDCVVM